MANKAPKRDATLINEDTELDFYISAKSTLKVPAGTKFEDAVRDLYKQVMARPLDFFDVSLERRTPKHKEILKAMRKDHRIGIARNPTGAVFGGAEHVAIDWASGTLAAIQIVQTDDVSQETQTSMPEPEQPVAYVEHEDGEVITEEMSNVPQMSQDDASLSQITEEDNIQIEVTLVDPVEGLESCFGDSPFIEIDA